jgi:hypothetical protein
MQVRGLVPSVRAVLILMLCAAAFAVGHRVTADSGSALAGSPYNGRDAVQDTAPTPIATGTDCSEFTLGACTNGDVKNDNALGQGSKDDNACPTRVVGSIPPNKSDISNFATAIRQGSNGHTFAYFAWNRTNVLGSANFSFELNRGTTPCANDDGLVQRSVNDLLVVFNFDNGGTVPTVLVSLWKTSGGSSQCQASNSVPCWGTLQNVTALGHAEGSVKLPAGSKCADSDGPNCLRFGEAVVDLTAANVPMDACQPFASSFVKGRSSSAFSAELKDFSPPVPLTSSGSCAVKWLKVSAKGNAPLGGACFSLTPTGGGTADIVCDNTAAGVTVGSNTTTRADSDSTAGTLCASGVATGSYDIEEISAPTGYLKSSAKVSTGNVTQATCGTATSVGTFVNMPLSLVQIKFTSLAGPGVTAASISCKNAANQTVPAVSENGQADPAYDDTDETFGNSTTTLTPGVYTCIIDVDP